MTPFGRRLYKLSFASSLFLAAPLLFGVAWYAWSAYASLDRYRRSFDREQKIDAELFHIALHDELMSDLRRLRQGARPNRLPTFSLSLSRTSLDAIADRKNKGYVKGHLEKDGRVHEIEVRYRGDQPWHAVGQQKSMKLRLDRGDLIDGVRVFNLINDPTPFGLEDQIILDLAREEGLLTPEYHPVWVRLNNHDMGVYRFEAQPDETMIRRAGRTPGNMFSGDSDTTGQPLFYSAEGWQKIASRFADQTDQAELDRLIQAVSRATHREFAQYAQDELDLPRYAFFDALDVVFGGSEHDWFSNWKFYADPYRGKIEPVAWSFRGFQHEAAFNVIDAPLLIRLKMTPGYLALRDRKVYELLIGKASLPAIRERTDEAMNPLTGELAADPYWDAYKQLPRASRFHRFYVRPMNLERWALGAAYELEVFAERSRWLIDALEDPGIEVHRNGSRIDLRISGHAAYELQSVRTNADCSGSFSLFADSDLDGRFDPKLDARIAEVPHGESVRVVSHRDLAARTVLVPHPDPKPKRGAVRAETEPTTFTFFAATTGCQPAEAALLLESSVVGTSMRIDLFGPEDAPAAKTSSISVESVPRFVAGDRAPHPWAFPIPAEPLTIALGPGTVKLPESRTFGAHETVEIAPGTTLALGKDASLIFHGRLRARGTPGRPISLVRLQPDAPFGGIALQGPGAAGSRLHEVRIEGGSRIGVGQVDLSALVNIHDTSDVEIGHLTIDRVRDAADVIHANTVRDLSLHDVTVRGAPIDAIDLEFVSADLRGISIRGAGDDCLDLMGSQVRLQDSLLEGCGNNGISAGEESDVTANRVVIARAKTGVLAKNASQVRVLRSLLYQTKHALKAKRKQVRYGGLSRIGTSDVFVAGAEIVHDADRGSTIEIASVRTEMPENGELQQVREQVLRLTDWTELDRFLGGAQ